MVPIIPTALAPGPVRFGWIHSPYRVELTHARFSQQQFAPHSHEGWSLCAVISGKKNIALLSQPQQLAQAGDIYLLHPDQAHAGGSVDEHPCEYVMLSISNDEWQEHCLRRNMPARHQGILPVRHPFLCGHIASFVLRVLAADRQADWSQQWRQLLHVFFDASAALRATIPGGVCDRRIWTARDYLHSNWSKPVALEALGDLAALSKFELARRFRAAYGLPPHRYQMNLRVMRAKEQLLRGRPISDVATATGFSDQSHLGRVFKSILGITPGALSSQIGPHFLQTQE